MGKKVNTELFVKNAIAIHGDRYDYSESIYTRANNLIKIKCKSHGDFFQRAAHHSSGSGCPKCAIDAASARYIADQESILMRFKEKHGDFYSYSLVFYTGMSNKVKIKCPDHGVFEQTPMSHLSGSGCNICANKRVGNKSRFTTEKFILLSEAIHGKRYDYSDSVYSTSQDKIKIICRSHGSFYQIARAHTIGFGCERCGAVSATRTKLRTGIDVNIYSRSKYIDLAIKNHNGLSNLYLIKCRGNNELFYKIGISVNKAKYRFSSGMPYSLIDIKEFSLSADAVWDLEKKLHKELSHLSYTPKIKFNGYTECFSNIPDEIYRFVESLAP